MEYDKKKEGGKCFFKRFFLLLLSPFCKASFKIVPFIIFFHQSSACECAYSTVPGVFFVLFFFFNTIFSSVFLFFSAISPIFCSILCFGLLHLEVWRVTPLIFRIFKKNVPFISVTFGHDAYYLQDSFFFVLWIHRNSNVFFISQLFNGRWAAGCRAVVNRPRSLTVRASH